jgi:hypothetical protein
MILNGICNSEKRKAFSPHKFIPLFGKPKILGMQKINNVG